MDRGCFKRQYFIDGAVYDAIPYGHPMEHLPKDAPEHCHDCGARLGEYHHPGCDMERCPRCGTQMINYHKNCRDIHTFRVFYEEE